MQDPQPHPAPGPWGQQLPMNVCGFCFPWCKFFLQNKGGEKKMLGFFSLIPFDMKVEGVVSVGSHSGGDGPQAALQSSFIPLILFYLF